MSEEIKTTNTEQQPATLTQEDKGGQGGRMFTQDEVNRIVSDRLAREREKLTQQPQESEREKALREREQALEAREERNKRQDYLKELGISQKHWPLFMDVLDTLDFDRFKAIVNSLGRPYIPHTVTIGANTATPPLNNGGADDAIAAAFKPKI